MGLLAALAELRRLGYAGFECNVKFVQGRFQRIAQARKEIEAAGVRLISVHTAIRSDRDSIRRLFGV